MIIDKNLNFCSAAALTGVSASSTSTIGSVLDFGANRDWYDTARNPGIAKSGQLWLTVQCDGADFASAGSPSITITLATKSTSASFSSGATAIISRSGILKTPNEGDILIQAPLPNTTTIQRYLGINVLVGTAALTAGKITAFISTTYDAN